MRCRSPRHEQRWEKLAGAVTDPARVRRTDPGDPDKCNLYAYHRYFSPDETLRWVEAGCRSADIGCFDCKKRLNEHMEERLGPIRDRMASLHDDDVRQFLKDLFALVIDDDKKKEKEKQGKIPGGLEYYPLTDAAMDEFVNLAISAPTASLPRNFISALNEGAVRAARRDSHVIDTDDLTPAQAIFTEGV